MRRRTDCVQNNRLSQVMRPTRRRANQKGLCDGEITQTHAPELYAQNPRRARLRIIKEYVLAIVT